MARVMFEMEGRKMNMRIIIEIMIFLLT
jgi:hypothetical protein